MRKIIYNRTIEKLHPLKRHLKSYAYLALVILLIENMPEQAMAEESRCTGSVGEGEINCTYNKRYVRTSWFTKRSVVYEVPIGEAPAGGWPVVILFQGSLFPIEFSRDSGLVENMFNAIYEVDLIKTLLDNGYAVVAPRAAAGLAYLNVFPYKLTTDYIMMNNLLKDIKAGKYGPINYQKKFAGGISSGGYMASEVGLSHPGEFKAIMVHSASYARCMSVACVIPSDLPETHPPTILFAGFFDPLVPWWTVEWYHNTLLNNGIDSDLITGVLNTHQYIEAAPQDTLAWFDLFVDE